MRWQFFLITNFSTWFFGAMYPHTLAGLVTCYIAALPFFGYTSIGNPFYSAFFFGAHFWLTRRQLADGMKRALLSWSSGKDSAWSLHVLRGKNEVEIVGLLTTLNAEYDRVAMHAVRRKLLRKQADAAGLELWPVPIPSPCSNAEYETAMGAPWLAPCERA